MLPVVDEHGRLLGTCAVDAVRSAVAADEGARAGTLMEGSAPTVRADDTVQQALDLLALQHVDELPVVGDDGRLIGLLDRRDVLAAYRRRIDELRR